MESRNPDPVFGVFVHILFANSLIMVKLVFMQYIIYDMFISTAKEVTFSVWLVCLSVSFNQDCAKTTRPIFLNVGRRVEH